MRTIQRVLIGLVALMLVLPAASPAQMNYPSRVVQSGSPKDQDALDVQVWTNKEEGASFGQGENLIVYFRANQDCYVTIYDLDTKGDVSLLFPYDPDDDNRVEAGVVYTIPDYYDDFVLRVSGPPGLEFIQAFAASEPYQVPDWDRVLQDDDRRSSIDRESEALEYLDYLSHKFLPVDQSYGQSDLNYTFLKVRRDWKYAWDSYYDSDYDYWYANRYYHHRWYYHPVSYDPWWDPWDWCGTVYIDWPIGGAIWIDGVFYGYAPLFVPRVVIGWHTVRIWHSGRVFYTDRIRIVRGNDYQLYHEGAFKWKSKRRGVDGDPVARKYYPESRSLSYKSAAKFSAGGRTGEFKKYASPERLERYKATGERTKEREVVKGESRRVTKEKSTQPRPGGEIRKPEGRGESGKGETRERTKVKSAPAEKPKTKAGKKEKSESAPKRKSLELGQTGRYESVAALERGGARSKPGGNGVPRRDNPRFERRATVGSTAPISGGWQRSNGNERRGDVPRLNSRATSSGQSRHSAPSIRSAARSSPPQHTTVSKPASRPAKHDSGGGKSSGKKK